jgi:hypothetical protein
MPLTRRDNDCSPEQVDRNERAASWNEVPAAEEHPGGGKTPGSGSAPGTPITRPPRVRFDERRRPTCPP